MSPSSPSPGEAGRLFREGNLADALTALRLLATPVTVSPKEER
jgi:hypothetical protein